MARVSKLEREIIKCGKDPIYFIEKYIKVCNSQQSNRLVLTTTQKKLINHIINNDLSITVKARSIGATVIEIALSIWNALFHKNKTIIIVSVDQQMNKHYATIINDILTDNVLCNLIYAFNAPRTNRSKSKKNYLFEFVNGSSIYCYNVINVTNSSLSADFIILDECTLYSDLQNIMAHITPLIKKGGKLALISTPTFTTSYFYKLATDKSLSFSTITLPHDNNFSQINYHENEHRNIYRDLENLFNE